MQKIKIIFLDINGDELYSKTNEFFDVKDAAKYATEIVANGRSNENSFEIIVLTNQ